LKKAEDQKAKLEADKKGKYLDNFKCNFFALAAADQAKKLADEKTKLEQDKKGKFQSFPTYRFNFTYSR
jgi:hypothetical protein